MNTLFCNLPSQLSIWLFKAFLAPCIQTVQPVNECNKRGEHTLCTSSVASDRLCLSLASLCWRNKTSCFTEPTVQRLSSGCHPDVRSPSLPCHALHFLGSSSHHQPVRHHSRVIAYHLLCVEELRQTLLCSWIISSNSSVHSMKHAF